MPNPSISNFIEQHRILPTDTPFPGPWRNDKTPYLTEIMDNMGPYSGVIKTSVMKGAQIGVTAAVENVLAYWMKEYPAACMFVIANDALCKSWGAKRLEPLINSIGFRDKIMTQLDEYKSRRTGDTIYEKKYPGGFLKIASAQAAGSLRSDSIRILSIDELDGCPAELRSGEGNFNDVVEARTNAYSYRARIIQSSTPTTFEASLISREYEMGDQRKYHVPCPYCGYAQELVFENLKPDTHAGRLVNAYYLCSKCSEAIFNNQKYEMLRLGQWIPTAQSSVLSHRSYHISALYSPPGLESWTSIYQKYQKAQRTPAGMRSFVNLCLGLPYKESGSRPKIEKVIELRGAYTSRTVPHGVLYLTFGIDVQRGSDTDPANPPRLEMEIVGHGAGYRTWGIMYQTFEGALDDPYAGAWEVLYEWADAKNFTFRRADGRTFQPVFGFVDSGDGQTYDVVYRFCNRWVNTFPSKGYARLTSKNDEGSDPFSPSRERSFRKTTTGKADGKLFLINTNHYKRLLYNNLRIERQPLEPQRPGFCDFPIDYDQRYFEMLTAEELRVDGSFTSAGRRNEALDCRVMALCAGDVFLGASVTDMQAYMKSQGMTADQLMGINYRYVLDYMAKLTEGPM